MVSAGYGSIFSHYHMKMGEMSDLFPAENLFYFGNDTGKRRDFPWSEEVLLHSSIQAIKTDVHIRN